MGQGAGENPGQLWAAWNLVEFCFLPPVRHASFTQEEVLSLREECAGQCVYMCVWLCDLLQRWVGAAPSGWWSARRVGEEPGCLPGSSPSSTPSRDSWFPRLLSMILIASAS